MLSGDLMVSVENKQSLAEKTRQPVGCKIEVDFSLTVTGNGLIYSSQRRPLELPAGSFSPLITTRQVNREHVPLLPGTAPTPAFSNPFAAHSNSVRSVPLFSFYR